MGRGLSVAHLRWPFDEKRPRLSCGRLRARSSLTPFRLKADWAQGVAGIGTARIRFSLGLVSGETGLPYKEVGV